MDILIGTITMRPYVFAFFAAFLLACVPHVGWRRTLAFTGVGYLIAFASEWLSINIGFPYGWYYYIDSTSNRELWVAGVPFFDSLSYVFLSYCSYATALFILSPLRAWRWNMVSLETHRIRRSLSALTLGAFLQTFLDIIIDPVALQGDRWFLGQIYGYREAGIHFGVPISNYWGWLLTSLFLMGAFQLIDARRPANAPTGVCNLPFRSLLGPVLYLSVLLFNLGVTIWIGEYFMAVTGILMCTLPVMMVVMGGLRRVNRYSREELGEHLRDYPWSAAGDIDGHKAHEGLGQAGSGDTAVACQAD
jgi:putative membrane protein